jgi:hypothetical protein
MKIIRIIVSKQQQCMLKTWDHNFNIIETELLPYFGLVLVRQCARKSKRDTFIHVY